MKRKLLLVSNMYPSEAHPSFGVFVKKIYDYFDDGLFDKNKCVIASKPVSLLSKMFTYIKFNLEIFFALLFSKYDFVYCHYVSHVLFFPVLAKILGANFKLVGHVHGSDVHGKSSFVFYLLSSCDVIVVPSRNYQDYIRKKIGEKTPIFVSPSGGVPDEFYSVSKSIRNNCVGFVGRLVKVKRPDRFKKLIDYIMEVGGNFSFEVVGDGNLCGIFDPVSKSTRLWGSASRMQLPSMMRNMDFIIITSERESLCLVALEAMASGTIVIANDCGGVSDYIINNQNGFIVDMTSPSWESHVFKILNMTDEKFSYISNESYKTALDYRSSIVNKRLTESVFNKQR